MASQQMIAEVEAALVRLLDPSTPAGEKAEIEQQLAQLKAAPQTCLPILYQLLSASSSEYALWFAATTLEEYVAKTWATLPVHDQQQLRQFAWEYLTAHARGVALAHSAFVVRKLRKVIADIARLEWRSSSSDSASWPDFLTQVDALVGAEATRLGGLELLSVVAEEFGRDDALAFAAIKRDARAQLTASLPQLLALLTNVLSGCNEQLERAAAAGGGATIDSIAVAALETLTHLVQWAPVAALVSDQWIALLFALSRSWSPTGTAALQCLTDLLSKRFAPERVASIVAAAAHFLCPLLRQTTAQAGEVYLDKLSALVEAFVTHHLQRLERVDAALGATTAPVLPELLQLVLALTTQQPHVDGLIHCLSVWDVFVSHLEDAETYDSASASDAAQQTLALYERGLVGVMFHLVDRINYATNAAQLEELDADDDDDDDGEKERVRPSDVDALAGAEVENNSSASAVGCSFQDRAQWSVTRASGASTTTANVELSDRTQFIVDCLALVQRIAALPACAVPLLERVLPRVDDACASLLFRIHETPAPAPQSTASTIERCAINDLTINVAVLASVCAHYYSTSNDLERQMAGWQILHRFLSMSEYLTTHRMQTRGAAFCQLEVEVLTAIRSCLSCVPFVMTQSNARDDVLRAIESVVHVLLTTLDSTLVPSPPAVMQTAMQLLASIGFVLPYAELVRVPSIASLERNIHAFSLHLPLTIQGDLFTAMATSILNAAISLQGSQEGITDTTTWRDAYAQLIVPLRESLDASALTLQQNDARVLEHAIVVQIQRDCYIVRCLARSVETKPKVAKDAFFAAYELALPALQALLTTFVTALRRATTETLVKRALTVVNELIRLVAQLLASIRKEMARESVADLMRVFVELFRDAQLTQTLGASGAAGVAVLCGFLQLLRIVVEEPTAVFASFLQNILELCFGPLKEAIFYSDAAVMSAFVALVEQLLEKHYRFFVSPNVTFNADGTRERSFASDVARMYFVAILESLLQVLRPHDSGGDTSNTNHTGASLSPRLCAQVLAVLDRIDRAHGLFAFAGFRSELRMQFLSTLLNLLTRGEMNLLQDEIVQLLHRVAAADFASFYQTFLPTYMEEILTPQEFAAAARQQQTCLQWTGQTDVPTFTQELLSFLNDLRVLKSQT